ncbi:hypothetical protein [Mycolicibacterium goodii]|uniref:hypothetical protein n=1 Tax=Mycolicibacterium goodii TaxID=134601 RepID=UPI001BDCFFC8|nr:hypothetical protein [Mycolicibacterium goodii]MBU8841543.1 hypothetical protein [Mycolicibacterium goodii]
MRAFAKPHENSGVVYVQPGEVNGSEWVEITSAGRTLLTPLVDVDFPRWKSLIPDNAPLRVALRRAELLEATSGEEIILTIDNDDDEVTVISVNGDLQIEQRIELFQRMRDEFDEPFTVKLRSKFVEEALRNISSAVVLLEVSGPTKPVVLRDVSELDLHLVMPLKTEGAEAKAG